MQWSLLPFFIDMNLDWQPIILTFKLAAITTLILLLVGLPLAYWLAYSQRKRKVIIETLVNMPLVLPPSVLGFYLLIAFSPDYFFGQFLDNVFGLRLVFSFEGLVVGSVIYSLPFMVQPLQTGFKSVPDELRYASYTLGKSKWVTFWKVVLPNIRSSLMTGVVLSFAHTIGEFGVVLMIGGNLPDKTRVASVAIYNEVEALNYDTANMYALILLGFSFFTLFVIFALRRQHFLK